MSSLFQKLAGLSFMKVVFVLILRKVSFESRLRIFVFELKMRTKFITYVKLKLFHYCF